MANVGFIGLGIMGSPMAGHLIKGGHRVFLHSRGGVAQALTDAGGIACANGKDLARNADVIITMVPDTPHVEDVLFGDNGVAQGLSKGKIVVDMSSISPIETKEFAKRINALGCEYLDAPVSGGEVGAKAASLTIMVGGTDAAFAKVKPLFELMGKNITLVGGNGDGQTCKVANQIIVALTIEAVSEGSQSGARFRAQDRCEPAQHGDLPGAVQRLRRPWRQGLGPLGHGPRAGEYGELRNRSEALSRRDPWVDHEACAPRTAAPNVRRRSQRGSTGALHSAASARCAPGTAPGDRCRQGIRGNGQGRRGQLAG